MKTKIESVITETLELDEETIIEILKSYIISIKGEEWKDAQYSIFERNLPATMGQIDDQVETVAKIILRKLLDFNHPYLHNKKFRTSSS